MQCRSTDGGRPRRRGCRPRDYLPEPGRAVRFVVDRDAPALSAHSGNPARPLPRTRLAGRAQFGMTRFSTWHRPRRPSRPAQPAYGGNIVLGDHGGFDDASTATVRPRMCEAARPTPRRPRFGRIELPSLPQRPTTGSRAGEHPTRRRPLRLDEARSSSVSDPGRCSCLGRSGPATRRGHRGRPECMRAGDVPGPQRSSSRASGRAAKLTSTIEADPGFEHPTVTVKQG